MSVIAPFVYETFSHEPYCTVQEVLNSPTAASVDFTNLIPDTSLGAQNAAIEQLIIRASQMADNFVYGALGTLCATVNTENGRYKSNRLGQFVIQPYYWPILELQSFSAGVGPGSGMTSVPLSSNNVSIERYQFIITPQYGLSTTVQFSGLSGLGQWGYGTEQFCEWTYVNGFANAFTTSASVKGATSINVTSATGIYPGSVLTIWDGTKDENVQIASTYVPGSTTLPLTSGLNFSHTANTNVSALPATVKQAVIHFVVAMVKERGSGALVINELGEPVAATGREVTHEWDLTQGYDLLDEFRQVWGRA